MFDVIVVGGGPAGLSAALMLGRCRRQVLVCDNGLPRNRRSKALHAYLTRDGVRPTDFNALGRAELVRYGVELRTVGVSQVSRDAEGFHVVLSDGLAEWSRFLLIATGVVDDLPAIPGLDDCYGQSVFHCPYCDGWEWRDRQLAVLGAGLHSGQLALSLKTWSPHVVLCSNGTEVEASARERLERNGIPVRTEAVTRLVHHEGLVSLLEFEVGVPLTCDAVFFTTGQHPQCDLAVRLGCQLNQRGTVDTGTLSETNVPGVFVAGDASRDAQFVVVAAAEGIKAALAINQAMQKEELHP